MSAEASWLMLSRLGQERRLNPRRRVDVTVYLSWPGERLRSYKAYDLSERGAFVEIDRPVVSNGMVVRMVFVLGMGAIVRLHCVRATVTRVSRHGVGLKMLGYCRGE